MRRVQYGHVPSCANRLSWSVIVWVSLGACSVMAAPAAVTQAGSLPASKQVFEKLILDRIQAFGRGDAGSYVKLVDPNFVHISDMGDRRTVEQLEPYIASKKSSEKFAVRDLSFRIIGQVAIVDCEIVLSTGALATQRMRELDVFEVQGSRWVFVSHAETIVQESDVSALPADPQILQQYVGRYLQPGGGTDLLAVSNGQLMGRDSPEAQPTPLVRIAADTFVLEGDPSVTIFERDLQGNVSGYALRLGNGHVIRATKSQ